MYLYKLVLKNRKTYLVKSDYDMFDLLEKEIKLKEWNSFELAEAITTYIGNESYYTNRVVLKVSEIVGIEG
jgi:hypothetical protein